MFLLSAPLNLATIATPSSPSRAMWVWKTDAILNENSKRDELFDFLRSPKGNRENRISVIFFNCDLAKPNFDKIAALNSRAHHQGIRVDYLCGDPNYAQPDHWSDGLAQIDLVKQFNLDRPKDERFDGIQFDVEPNALSGWPNPEIIKGYLGFLAKAQDSLRSWPSRIQEGVAIPRWFDAPSLNNLYQSVLGLVDYVALMDYVSNPRSFIDDAANTVAYAGRSGKQVWLGAEVSELPTEPTATFYALGNAKLEDTFVEANQHFKGVAGYAGVAVEWYDTYRQLKP